MFLEIVALGSGVIYMPFVLYGFLEIKSLDIWNIPT